MSYISQCEEEFEKLTKSWCVSSSLCTRAQVRDKEKLKAFMSSKLTTLLEKIEKEMEGRKKHSAFGTPFCRNCNFAMVKATGMGSVVFPYQCPNCGNYQEGLDERASDYNQCLSDLQTFIKKLKE